MAQRANRNMHHMVSSDEEWNGSCCDYKSDVFKEQPSTDQFSYADEFRSAVKNFDSDYEAYQGRSQFQQSPLKQELNSQRSQNSQASKQQIQMVQQQKLKNGSIFNQRQNSVQVVSNMNHHRQPNYSVVPEKIHKNADMVVLKKEQPVLHSQKQAVKGKVSQNKVLNDENNKLNVQTQQHQRNYIGTAQTSYSNLTPVKQHPLPMSPGQKPDTSYQNDSCQVLQLRNPQTSNNYPTGRGGSAQKIAVVYDEFKYFSSSTSNPNNNLIQVTSNTLRKSDSSGYELSPTQHQIFEIKSPRAHLTTRSDEHQSSHKKQAFTFGGSYAEQPRNNISRHDSFNLQEQINEMRAKIQEQELRLREQDQQLRQRNYVPVEGEYECKIQQLQDQIEQLEFDLKSSMEKNTEMKRQLKDKSFLQSLDRNGSRIEKASSLKHLTDTEDSIILSEKKQRLSLTKGSKSSSSIVDVKIKPIANMKCGGYKQDSCEEDQDHDMEYGVDHHQEMASEQNIEELQDEEEQENQECESCERLKQLVFQAKEAIDDLKLEIEEWREISAQKETELRQIHHRLYSDLIGIDKNVAFDDDGIQTKEFDSSKPVCVDANRVKNFIKHNKKKIRQRSKHACDSSKKSHCTEFTIQGKKGVLKNFTDCYIQADKEFFVVEDQGIQTSFLMEQCDSTQYLSKTNKLSLGFTSGLATQMNTQCSPKFDDFKENTNPIMESEHKQLLSQQEELIENLKMKLESQDSEIVKQGTLIQQLTKKCETVFNLINKVQKNRKAKQPLIDLQEIQQNYELVSDLESYSILEKINEWKKEEGLTNGEAELLKSKIPRPLKLLSEINLDTIQLLQPETTKDSQMEDYFKTEQMQLKKQQEQKYKELQRFQQEYLQQLTS